MVFNRNKGFFLTLDDAAAPATLEVPQKEASQEKQATAEPSVATTTLEAPKPTGTAPAPAAAPKAAPAPKASPVAKAVAEPKGEDRPQSSSGMTTAEAIAAELAAADASRPAVTYTTFAPRNLAPGGGLRQRSRRPGAALKSFRGITKDLFKS
uniref:hypothetical protein n=1 Tax=Synechococcus sp. UW106 TaxID=368495 RepID=UPI000E0EDC14|nr:hypothetical protein [Synechococcus sp. UW106]